MMPNINVSTSLYDKLKGLADPFSDTPESVITRCVEFYISNKAGHKPAPAPAAEDGSPLPFPADGAPDLRFTRPLAITLDGDKFEKQELYWNPLLFEMVRRAAKKLPADKLNQSILVNHTPGKVEEGGYHYIEEADLSVQGQAANAAWKAIMHLAQAAGMKVDVTFLWETKDKAAHPGKTARMVYEPA